VILALSTGQKLALLIVAGVFIAFALVSSFLLPRSDPDFPGRRLPLFVAVTVGLLVAMLAAMVVFARESEEEGAHAAETAQTETGGGETAPGETAPAETEPAGGEGDAAAGKKVFASAGCGSCHTLADAGSTGTIGPNFDELKPDHELVVTTVTNGKGAMPPFKGQLDEQQIQDVAAYVSSAAGS
jgi:mono/diheme cytochrome c family protein